MSATVKGALIVGICTIIAAIITSPLWWHLINEEKSTFGTSDKTKDTISISSLTKIDPFRKLRPLETDKHITELPNGIYGFLYAHSIVYGRNDELKVYLRLKGNRIGRLTFEVQKQNDEIFILGYISDEAYSKIGLIDTTAGMQVTLFPDIWGDFKNIVSIPFNSIKNALEREIEIDSVSRVKVLELRVSKILTSTYSH